MDWSFEREAPDGTEQRLRATADGDSIPLPAGWFGDDSDWRRAYRAIVEDCFPDRLSFGDAAVTVPRGSAVTALADAESLSADRSEALLAYFDSEGVVELSGASVAVLFDPDEDRPLAAERWTAVRGVLADAVERIDAELKTQPDPEALADRVESRLEAIAEEIRDLTPGADAPDPEELTDDQRDRFEQLKREFAHYKNLQAANVDPPRAVEPGLTDRAESLRAETTPPDSLDAFRNAVEALTSVVDAAEDEEMASLYDQHDRLVQELDGLTDQSSYDGE